MMNLFKKKSLNWYISYVFTTKEGNTGYGHRFYSQQKYRPITREYLGDVLTEIKESNEFKGITLLSYGRLEG